MAQFFMIEDLMPTDRLVVIENEEELAKLKADPEGFLREIGALDGLDRFNGIDLSRSIGPVILCKHKPDCDWEQCKEP